MGKIYNINSGDIFGRLVVIGKVEDSINKKSKKHESQYLCRCTCKDHNTIVVKGKNLINGHTKSCGCIRKEEAKRINCKDIPYEELEYPDIYP